MKSRILSGWVICLLVLFMVGCNVHSPIAHPVESGYSDFGKIQLQFYAPEGAQVIIGQVGLLGDITPRITHQVGSYGEGKHRLELTPEQTATFNLAPGRYEFKYVAAEGWPGASIYGELEVYGLSLCAPKGAYDMLKRCFIPIALPSPGILNRSDPKDVIFPYASPVAMLRINQSDVERLAAGDLVTKVVFIADLEELEKKKDAIEIKLTELRAEKRRLQALLNEAQLEWLENPHERGFIRYEKEIKKVELQMEKLEDLKGRIEVLLRADNVLIRREMLVLATDEVLPVHTDPVRAASELGDVVLVMKLGGRHMHWGRPAEELTEFNK